MATPCGIRVVYLLVTTAFLLEQADAVRFENLGESNVTVAMSNYHMADADARRIMCEDKMVRFHEIDLQGRQASIPNGDPFFKEDLESIAPIGSDCGDKAQGISKPCDKFNSWSSMKEVSKKMFPALGGVVQVFDSDGASFEDIGQGKLGTCYFLGALASIAKMHPEIIVNMFDGDTKTMATEGVYTTKWLINGKRSYVSVNDMIPAMGMGKPWFVQPGNSGEFWPIILEKTWAKIFSNFKATEGGLWAEAVAAITMAPVSFMETKEGEVKVQNYIAEGIKKRYPMGASTGRETRFGLAKGHQYSVMDMAKSAAGPVIIQMYNPWRFHGYQGRYKNTGDNTGLFWMYIDEFVAEFVNVQRADIIDQAVVQSLKFGVEVPGKTENPGYFFSLRFEKPPGNFAVSLTWPGKRMVQPCEPLSPMTTLLMKSSSGELAKVGSNQNSKIAESSGLSTEYFFFAHVTMNKEADYIHNVYLTLYTSSGANVLGLDPVDKSPVAIVGPHGGAPCENVMIRGPHKHFHGLYSLKQDMTIRGIPTYWSHNREYFAYYGDERGWLLTKQDAWAVIRDTTTISYVDKFEDKHFQCGCADISIPAEMIPGHHSCHSLQPRCAQKDSTGLLVRQLCPMTCRLAKCER